MQTDPKRGSMRDQEIRVSSVSVRGDFFFFLVAAAAALGISWFPFFSGNRAAPKSSTVCRSTPAAPFFSSTLQAEADRFSGFTTLSNNVCHRPLGETAVSTK